MREVGECFPSLLRAAFRHDDCVASFFSSADGGADEAGGELGRDVFHGVHYDVDSVFA